MNYENNQNFFFRHIELGRLYTRRCAREISNLKKVEHELFGPNYWLAVNVKNCDKGPPKKCTFILIRSKFRRYKSYDSV